MIINYFSIIIFIKLNIFEIKELNIKYFITLSKIIYLIYLYLDLQKNKIIDI